MADDEPTRAARLLDAQAKAVRLFAAIEERGLVAPGERERAVSDRIRDLANELFGTTRHWHKRIVRSGPNTLEPYRENPPDRVIGTDDIVFADFGPIFEEYEADFGRTFVLGDDPVKHRLRDDLPKIFAAGRSRFEADPDITGARLYAEIERLAAKSGWKLGVGTRATWSASSRTSGSTAPTWSRTSRPPTAPHCAVPTRPDAAATGSWRSISSTRNGGSAASTRNCSPSDPARLPVRRDRCARSSTSRGPWPPPRPPGRVPPRPPASVVTPVGAGLPGSPPGPRHRPASRP